jgi:hypothetical protein
MTHRACQAVLLELAYGELGKRKAARALAHMAECEPCRSEYERLGATRKAMQSLGRMEPSAANERILLAAARQAAAERAASQQRFILPSWVWKASLTTALVLVVGGVSFQLLSIREGKMEMTSASAPVAMPEPAVQEPAAPRAAPPALTADAPEAKLKGLGGVGSKVERAAPLADVKGGKRPRTRTDSASGAGAARPERKQSMENAERSRRLTDELRASEESAPPAAAPEPEAAPKPAPRAMAPAKKAPVAKDDFEDDSATNEKPFAGAEGSASLAFGGRTEDKRDLAAPADPRVEAVKALVEGIERQRLLRRLTESGRVLETCAGSTEAERRIYRDDAGRAVKYVRRTESGNTAVTSEFYYDGTGELRLALVNRTSPGGPIETRTYFDERGRRLHEERSSGGVSSAKGAGEGTEQELTRNPEAAFRRRVACP